jgi:hypothetical protein
MLLLLIIFVDFLLPVSILGTLFGAAVGGAFDLAGVPF